MSRTEALILFIVLLMVATIDSIPSLIGMTP